MYCCLLIIVLLLMAACGSGSSNPTAAASATARIPARQILTFPNVGILDSAPLDPAVATDPNTQLIMSMIYSGLVRSDFNMNVVPDQATWDVSSDGKVYTFHLKSGIMFSDGTPVTAQTYAYSLTRALLPEVQSPTASLFEGVIAGASDVLKGKTRVLTGVRAINALTLQITLTHPTPYFLQMLTNPIYYPVNQRVIEAYGQDNWAEDVAGIGVGTGPFMVESWEHSVKMVLVPNPYYYGNKPRLTRIDMVFVSDPSTAFNIYRAGQYSFIWNISQDDQTSAKGFAGFVRVPQLETDALFFNTRIPPFDNPVVRQAFAYATDKQTLAHITLQDSVVPAQTIIPPGMPGYQPNYPGIPFNKNEARMLLQSVYPDTTTVPQITFSYPSSQMTQGEAAALVHMWQDALGIQIQLHSVEPTAYNDELDKHQVAFGFIQWNADFNDPYDALALNLLSTAANNAGQWSNATFDQLVTLAEKSVGDKRIALYQQAEQVAIQDVAWIPLDHQEMAAIIPPSVHGISVNGDGLYFGDWSQVYLQR